MNVQLKLLLSIVFAAYLPAQALADSLPGGWKTQADGGFLHVASGIVCKKTMGEFALVGLAGSSIPNLLGTCSYSGPEGTTSQLRVRQYEENNGESPAEDRHVMESVVNGASDVTLKVTDGPDGKLKTVAAIFFSHGLLVDSIQDIDQAGMNKAKWSFTADCQSLAPRKLRPPPAVSHPTPSPGLDSHQ